MDKNFPSCGPSTSAEISENITIRANHCIATDGYFYDGCEGKCYYSGFTSQSFMSVELDEVIYGTIFPVVVLLCILANLTVVLVLNRPHMCTATNVVLKYMAIADLMVGLVPLPWTFYYFTLG
ncbi:hypothetical protein WR25_07894 [Diploscapter pachys]|uniref:G-protein coupled receptors family 1 profile domain-containing protein n=1 Tax=Diploscapter pachys TaxID=2018661 RepID=A0A2A2LQQ4_9BILA|nr:hypothetical protein WR25_07894 [Diploscapter pachys]